MSEKNFWVLVSLINLRQISVFICWCTEQPPDNPLVPFKIVLDNNCILKCRPAFPHDTTVYSLHVVVRYMTFLAVFYLITSTKDNETKSKVQLLYSISNFLLTKETTHYNPASIKNLANLDNQIIIFHIILTDADVMWQNKKWLIQYNFHSLLKLVYSCLFWLIETYPEC